MHTGKKPASLLSSTAKNRDTLYLDNGGNSGTGYSLVGFHPATQRSIQRIRVGRFSASPALCTTGFVPTSPRQRLSKIDCCNYRLKTVAVKSFLNKICCDWSIFWFNRDHEASLRPVSGVGVGEFIQRRSTAKINQQHVLIQICEPTLWVSLRQVWHQVHCVLRKFFNSNSRHSDRSCHFPTVGLPLLVQAHLATTQTLIQAGFNSLQGLNLVKCVCLNEVLQISCWRTFSPEIPARRNLV